MTHQTTDTEWIGYNMQWITVTLEMYPNGYGRMREAAQAAQIPEPEFCALAIHKGVKMLMNYQADVNALLHPLNAEAMK